MQIEKQNRNLGTACSDTSGTDCSDSMVPITPLRVVPIQRYRHIKQGVCPQCGGQLVLRQGRYGSFYGCSNYPKCKFTLNK